MPDLTNAYLLALSVCMWPLAIGGFAGYFFRMSRTSISDAAFVKMILLPIAFAALAWFLETKDLVPENLSSMIVAAGVGFFASCCMASARPKS